MQTKTQPPVLSPKNSPLNHVDFGQVFEQLIYKIVHSVLELHPPTLPNQITEPVPENDITFSIPELAKYLKRTKATIHAYKKRRVFPFYQTGRTVYFKKSEVDAALSATHKDSK